MPSNLALALIIGMIAMQSKTFLALLGESEALGRRIGKLILRLIFRSLEASTSTASKVKDTQ